MATEKLISALKSIRDLAIDAAKKHSVEGEKYVDLVGEESSIKPPDLPLQEGLKDKIFALTQKILPPSLVVTLGSGITSIYGYTKYLSAEFNQWYYSVILKESKKEVFEVMQNLYGAKADAGSFWGKIALYIFFVFFVITLISIVARKATAPEKANKKLAANKPAKKSSINETKRMQQLAGLI